MVDKSDKMVSAEFCDKMRCKFSRRKLKTLAASRGNRSIESKPKMRSHKKSNWSGMRKPLKAWTIQGIAILNLIGREENTNESRCLVDINGFFSKEIN